MHSMKDSSSSSDDTSDEDDGDENSAGSDQDRVSKLLEKAKEKTMKVLEEEDEVPKSGLLSLTFMRRGLEKRKEAAVEEANILLQEYEESLMKLGSSGGSEDPKAASVSGRRVFGTAKPQISDAGNKVKSDNIHGSSDSEDDLGDNKNNDIVNGEGNVLQMGVSNDSVLIQEDIDNHQESAFKDTEKEFGEDSDMDSEGQMGDGILSSGSELSYELPSQKELIQQTFVYRFLAGANGQIYSRRKVNHLGC